MRIDDLFNKGDLSQNLPLKPGDVTRRAAEPVLEPCKICSKNFWMSFVEPGGSDGSRCSWPGSLRWGAGPSCSLMPDTYEATARVFVDSRTMLSQVTQGHRGRHRISIRRSNAYDRRYSEVLRSKRLRAKRSRTSRLVTPEHRQLIVSKLRDRITITGSANRENPTAGSYLISYTDESRDRSLQIVDRSAQYFYRGLAGRQSRRHKEHPALS